MASTASNMTSPQSNMSLTSSVYSLYTSPIIEAIPKYQFLVNNMPVRGADTCTVRIWLDLWFWAKHLDMALRLQLNRITWNAANVYSFPKRQLKEDLQKWGFEKNISKELARDIVKARKIVMSCSRGKLGFLRLIKTALRRYS